MCGAAKGLSAKGLRAEISRETFRELERREDRREAGRLWTPHLSLCLRAVVELDEAPDPVKFKLICRRSRAVWTGNHGSGIHGALALLS